MVWVPIVMVGPMGATHQEAVQGGVAVASKVGTDPERGLVGRSAELGQLRSAVRQVVDGIGQAVLVTGEAGIGKTRLVAEGLDGAGRLGVQVFRGAAEELERRRPFGAVADCLGIGGSPPDSRRAAIARLLAEDPGGIDGDWLGDTPQAEFRVVEAVIALVEELSAHSPVMLAVEDLQWADPSTLLVLQRLGRRVGQLPVLLVCTARPVPRSQELEGCLQLLRASGAAELLLGPLDGAATTRLVEQLVGAPPGSGLLAQVAGAGGNPLFVTELVGALQRDGSIALGSDGTAELTRVGIPPSLPLLILHRLSFLAPATLELLRVASVLGASFAVADLSAVVGRPTAVLLAALEEAIAAGILESRDQLLGFRHDLIWEALYQDLPAPLRRGLHRDAGRALAAAGAPPEQVAEQLVRGASPGDRQAVAWLQRAARAAAPRAPAVAVDLLQRALELVDRTDPLRDGLLAEQAVSLMWSGRLADAEAVCHQCWAAPMTPIRLPRCGCAWCRRCWAVAGSRRHSRKQTRRSPRRSSQRLTGFGSKPSRPPPWPPRTAGGGREDRSAAAAGRRGAGG
jgi:predicted ATPase